MVGKSVRTENLWRVKCIGSITDYEQFLLCSKEKNELFKRL